MIKRIMLKNKHNKIDNGNYNNNNENDKDE